MNRGEICMTVFLMINTWTDIRKREICLPAVGIFITGGILWRLTEGTFWPGGVLSIGIGFLATVISAMTGGSIGFGDGLLLMAVGSVLKAKETAGIFCGALLLCGIYAGIQLLILKKKKDLEIPFAPFLLAGYLGGVLF